MNILAKKILGEQPVSLAEVKQIINARKKDSEITYEQKKTLTYVKDFLKADEEKAVPLMKELAEMGIEKKIAAKIADFMPEDKDALRAVLSKEKTVQDKEAEKILELVAKYKA